MNINHKFSKQENAIIINLIPIIFHATIIIIALFFGINGEFYFNFLDALFIFLYPPLSVITILVIISLFIIVLNFISGKHLNSKQCINNRCADEEMKKNDIIRIFEVTNIILLIIFLIYLLFFALPQTNQVLYW
ncbi:MAG: hypothetical protein V3574_02125 [Candidatus Moraniibacteriota bacterium]